MSKKQIEELKDCIDSLYGCDCAYYGVEGLAIAEALYNAGYRKQSEGEWIKSPSSYECTACKEEFFVEGYAEDYDPITDWDLHFCPNCGAKMKGGAE